MKKLLFILLLGLAGNIFAQYDPERSTAPTENFQPEEVPRTLAATITSTDLRQHLSIIASDEYEGRETGTEGQKKAAEYIAGIFESYGLPRIGNDDSYFQKIVFTAEYWKDIELIVNGEETKHLRQFYSFPRTNTSRKTIEVEDVLFLGYGIDDPAYSDYEGVDVQGKVILIYDGEPVDKNNISQITGTEERSAWATDWRTKLRLAHKKGVSVVLLIDPQFRSNVQAFRREILNTRMTIGAGEEPEANYANNIHLSTNLARDIIGKSFRKVVRARKKMQRKGKAKNVNIECDLSITQNKRTTQLLGENVLGFVEGNDPERKDELIVVTAHYDHLGKRGNAIYNGADDNGSGTSTVLEVAQAFAEAKEKGLGPRRSVLFMLVSGEEKGLLGSEYYTWNPVFPLENTVANVNVDMVGRVDAKHEENPDYVYVIGSDRLSSELHEINETANVTYTNLELDYTYNADDDPNRYYYRSDHYNFAEKGIPAIFYFNGTHEDYHRTSDTVEKINFEKLKKIARLVFHTTWELANRDDRIKVDVTGRN